MEGTTSRKGSGRLVRGLDGVPELVRLRSGGGHCVVCRLMFMHGAIARFLADEQENQVRQYSIWKACVQVYAVSARRWRHVLCPVSA